MATSSTRRNVIVSLILGGLFLALAFQGIDLKELGHALQGADYVWLVPAFLVMGVLTAFRTWRLNYILSPTQEVTFWRGFAINSIGFMAINLFPARLGEFVRPYLFLEKEDISLGSGFGAVLMERLFDFLSMVSLIFIVALFIELPTDSITVFGGTYPVIELGRRMALFVAGPAILFVVALFLFENQIMTVLRFALRPFPKALGNTILGLGESFIQAMQQIRSPRFALTIAAWTILIWVVTPLGQYLILRAFGIPLGFDAAVAILTALLVGLLIPAPPGFAGSFEAFTMAGLALFAVTGEIALAYALVVHGVQFLSTVGLGLFFLWKDGISFGKLSEAGRKLREGDPKGEVEDGAPAAEG